MRTCDLRCRQARGQICRCWCSGRYHGRGVDALATMARDYGLELGLPVDFSMGDPGEKRRPKPILARGTPAPRRSRSRRAPARVAVRGQLALPLPQLLATEVPPQWPDDPAPKTEKPPRARPPRRSSATSARS